MSAEEIRRDVHDGLVDAATATGTGELNATLNKPPTRTGPDYRPVLTPSEAFTITCVLTEHEELDRKSLVAATKILLLVSSYGQNASGVETDITVTTLDRIVLDGKEYVPRAVEKEAYGGVTLMWEITAED
jgi:hypothetical protein